MALDTQAKTAQDGATTEAPPPSRDGSLSRRRSAAVRGAPQTADMKEAKQQWDPVNKAAIQVESNNDVDPSLRLHARLAEVIETAEMQTAIILLILFDLVSTVVNLLLRSHHEMIRLQSIVERSSSKKGGSKLAVDVTVDIADQPAMIANVVLRLLDALAGFTIVFFVIELVMLIATFRKRFFTHFGYVVDLLVVVLSIALEIYTGSQAVRLLGLLRVWRVFRLVGTLLEHEQKQHELTMDALEIEKTRVLQLQYEKQAAEQSLKRELESRAGIERMLQVYKDEADTLREALTIAAQAVAEATMMQHEVAPIRAESEEFSEGITSSMEATTAAEPWPSDATYAYDPSVDTSANDYGTWEPRTDAAMTAFEVEPAIPRASEPVFDADADNEEFADAETGET